MKTDVYIDGDYIVFEQEGTVIYDFKKDEFDCYQRQLIDKQWYTIEVENEARRLCNE